jgi:hypothetical protein
VDLAAAVWAGAEAVEVEEVEVAAAVASQAMT